MSELPLPVKKTPKKTTAEVFDAVAIKLTGASWSGASAGGKIIIGGLFFAAFATGAVSTTGALAWFSNKSNNTESTAQTALSGIDTLGTGGPEYEMFPGYWVHADVAYTCDERVWVLDKDREKTRVYYSFTTSMGETVQFDFISQSDDASNFAYGRAELYEIVLGDNSFDHLSLKDLRTGNFIYLYKGEDQSNGSTGRIKLQNSISTSTENTVIIKELFSPTSSTKFNLRITVNGTAYSSEEMSVVNREKYDVPYLGLTASEEAGKKVGVYLPGLRVCE